MDNINGCFQVSYEGRGECIDTWRHWHGERCRECKHGLVWMKCKHHVTGNESINSRSYVDDSAYSRIAVFDRKRPTSPQCRQIERKVGRHLTTKYQPFSPMTQC
jgi:hypothetical protein